jgi:hypothetical protein
MVVLNDSAFFTAARQGVKQASAVVTGWGAEQVVLIKE